MPIGKFVRNFAPHFGASACMHMQKRRANALRSFSLTDTPMSGCPDSAPAFLPLPSPAADGSPLRKIRQGGYTALHCADCYFFQEAICLLPAGFGCRFLFIHHFIPQIDGLYDG